MKGTKLKQDSHTQEKSRLQPMQFDNDETTDVCRLTDLSHGGGCGCKIDPAALHDILANVPKHALSPNLLVGIEHSDDAAVYRINDQQALVFTNDFFTATVDDGYIYGRIAAANALSDIYAMGGQPIMANAIVGFPVNVLPMETMQEIMRGGVDVCAEAGIPLSGGHSIDNPQPIFGLCAVGTIHPDNIKTNSSARVGDVLLLTKALGIGIMASAFKLKMISEAGYKEYIENITMLNKPGAWLGEQPSVHAMTDITGFGLAGHLIEMANGADVSMEINTHAIPVMEEAWHHLAEGVVPGGAYRNMSSYAESLAFAEKWDTDKQMVFTDPQTNGGLLVSVEADAAMDILTSMMEMGYRDVSVIGKVIQRREDNIAVSFL